MALEFASKRETFPKYRKFETTLAGRPFVVETGKMCALSNGSCMVRYGDTAVLCNVTMSDKPQMCIRDSACAPKRRTAPPPKSARW